MIYCTCHSNYGDTVRESEVNISYKPHTGNDMFIHETIPSPDSFLVLFERKSIRYISDLGNLFSCNVTPYIFAIESSGITKIHPLATAKTSASVFVRSVLPI